MEKEIFTIICLEQIQIFLHMFWTNPDISSFFLVTFLNRLAIFITNLSQTITQNLNIMLQNVFARHCPCNPKREATYALSQNNLIYKELYRDNACRLGLKSGLSSSYPDIWAKSLPSEEDKGRRLCLVLLPFEH